MRDEELERRAEIITDTSGGVNPPFEAFYLVSIQYSTIRCLSSFAYYEEMKDHKDVTADEVISLLQEAIGHAAALSRYFWPSPGGKKNKDGELKSPKQVELKKERGIKLRKAFRLNEKSPLYSRKIRNAWEHFDERLDKYLLINIAGNFMPQCILGSHQLADEEISHIFKLLDKDEECLVLLGEKYFFGEIRKEVERVYKLTVEGLNDDGRLV